MEFNRTLVSTRGPTQPTTSARKQTTHAHNLDNVLRGCEAPYFFLFVTARGLEEKVYPSINPAMALGRNPKAQGDVSGLKTATEFPTDR